MSTLKGTYYTIHVLCTVWKALRENARSGKDTEIHDPYPYPSSHFSTRTRSVIRGFGYGYG